MSRPGTREAPPVAMCGHCGAPAGDNARRCQYCHVELRSLRCARCYHWNIAPALHCAGCGYALGLQPVPEPAELKCAQCKSALQGFLEPSGHIYDCPECGGQFLEPRVLSALIRDAVTFTEPCLAEVPRVNPLTTPVRYRQCPKCKQPMNRKNFGGASGIIIDSCTKHGSWLDPGELPLILRFVRAGGLELERRRREGASSVEKRALHRIALGSSGHAAGAELGTRQHKTASPSYADTLEPALDGEVLSLVVTAGIDIIAWVSDCFD